jgi:type I site-specific restriction-modification system R (restriction) subunit
VDEIQDNHPYLGIATLANHAQNNQLFVVDVTEVSLNEPNVSNIHLLINGLQVITMESLKFMNLNPQRINSFQRYF